MGHYTKHQAIQQAKKYGLEEEVAYMMEHGYTPDEALREWDCFEDDDIKDEFED